MKNKAETVAFTTLFIGVIALDQILKTFFHKTENYGFVFGWFSGNSTLAISLSILAIIAIALYFFRSEQASQRYCLILIAAGLFSNLIDRVSFGYVRDFIKLGLIPTFNIADLALVAGVLLFSFIELKKWK